MGKKNKKGKTGVAEADTGMPRHLRREILAIANELLESMMWLLLFMFIWYCGCFVVKQVPRPRL